MSFVFCRLNPFSLQPPWQCLGLTCNLSTLHCIAGVGFLIPMMGEVGPKRKKSLSHLVFILSESVGAELTEVGFFVL
jgi:hypothetical protein